MSVKLLNEHHLEFLSLKEGCTGSSESTLVKMPHCWKSHVTAHVCMLSETDRVMKLLPVHLVAKRLSQSVLSNF